MGCSASRTAAQVAPPGGLVTGDAAYARKNLSEVAYGRNNLPQLDPSLLEESKESITAAAASTDDEEPPSSSASDATPPPISADLGAEAELSDPPARPFAPRPEPSGLVCAPSASRRRRRGRAWQRRRRVVVAAAAFGAAAASLSAPAPRRPPRGAASLLAWLRPVAAGQQPRGQLFLPADAALRVARRDARLVEMDRKLVGIAKKLRESSQRRAHSSPKGTPRAPLILGCVRVLVS